MEKMKKILLKKATIIAKKSPFHLQKKDMLIENGIIKKISNEITSEKDMQEITLENLHISGGWLDSSVCFGEPGYEEREIIKNGLKTAAKSGFTAVAMNPNTKPFIDHKSAVDFLKSQSEKNATQLYPIACATQNSNGQKMAELHDLHKAGAIAFGDYNKPFENENLLKTALLYAQNFGGLLLSFPMNTKIAGKALVNESVQNTYLGLKGMPTLAETLQIARDIALLKYTGGKLHIPTISCAESVNLIEKAKNENLNITCSVAVHHLLLTDEKLQNFETCYKVLPPLRILKDKNALLKALKNGLIDCVVSDHNPINIEHKKVPFGEALFGTIGLESFFPVLNNILNFEDFLPFLNEKPYEIFNLEIPEIKEGKTANLTLFNPEGEGIFTEKNIRSQSKNSLFIGAKTKGKVYGIIHKRQCVFNFL